MLEYGVRRAGDGSFYLVILDEYGDEHEFYSEGKLVKFDSSEEAKAAISGASVPDDKEIKPRFSAIKKWRAK